MNHYYQALKKRVDAGRLVFLSIVSPPRTGSTVLEKAIYNAYPVIAAQLNEPSSQIHAGEDRVSAMYQSIWDEVTKLETFAAEQGVDLNKHPLVLLTKNLFYYIGQDQEWQLYDALMAHHIVTVRHPAATFESYTKAIIETLDKLAVPLQQVIKSGCELSHINWNNPAQSPLRQHIAVMSRQRDYSSLGEGFRDAVAYQLPILGTCAYQREIWAGAKKKHLMDGKNPDQLAQASGFGAWDDLINQHLGTPLAAIKNLPPLLREPIDVLRYGWRATEINWTGIKSPETRLTVIDYYDFLLDSAYYLDKIGQLPGLKLNAPALGHVRSTFNLGVWEGEVNEEPFFNEVKRREHISRPGKGAIPIEHLPVFLHPHIKEAFRVYLKTLQSPQRLLPRFSTQEMLEMTGNDGQQRMQDLDPVHVYSQVAVTQDIPSGNERVRILATFRARYQVFFAYFNMIDYAVLQHKTES